MADSIKTNIQIFPHGIDMEAKDRLWISAGTQPVETHSHQQYTSDAHIPRLPWRNATTGEKATLIAQTAPEAYRAISLFRLPEEILSAFAHLGTARAQTAEEIRQLRENPEYQSVLSKLHIYLEPFFYSHERKKINPLSSNPANLETVTFDDQRQQYIGLHLDSWDQLPLAQRHESTTRMCINLGSEDRYLLFLDRTLTGLSEILRADNISIRYNRELPTLEKLFMHHYPHYPSIRLRIRPGEAYIGPTENMIHDGSTSGQTNLDVLLCIRGYLKYPQTKAAQTTIQRERDDNVPQDVQ